MLEETQWQRFPATQEGLETFVSTYRGPSSNYKLAKDYSYQIAMTLLTAGYDVLVCRVCSGTKALSTINAYYSSSASNPNLYATFEAKYPGTFGNNLKIHLYPVANMKYWTLIVYVSDAITGTQAAIENLVFTFDINNVTDTIQHINDIESNFLTISSNITTNQITFNKSGNGYIMQHM